MKITFRDLWYPAGSIARGPYALIGILGFALKHNLDRAVAAFGFQRPWGFFNYLVPLQDVRRITSLRNSDAGFLETMVAISLPFIWVGVVLTLKRLRSAKLPAPLVILFFVPFLNLFFFTFLCLIPERTSSQEVHGPNSTSWFTRIVPEGAFGSATFSLLITVPVGTAFATIGSVALENYGWGLFIALPFAMGLAAAVIHGVHAPRTLKQCVGVACLSVSILGLALLAIAVEGVFCILMAAPIALALATFGGVCGYYFQRRRWMQDGAPAFLSVLLLFVPSVQWVEHAAIPQPPIFVVRSTIDVKASPETVWKQVIAFTEIPPPEEWIFRAGVAYPIRAEITGSGVGAERHCVFSTGAFVEPIEIWDEPHRLKFSVTSNPAPMEEWTPYSHIEPAHLHGFLVSNGGQFLLTALPNGETRVEGTTWYRHGLWPSTYWKWWSDAIIHRIHMRVLLHIRDEAEKELTGERKFSF